MINISRLQKGMIIKNYKELCELLDVRVTSGGAKENQLILLNTYYDYHKQGNKFMQHYNKNNKNTKPYHMIHNDGKFNILHDMTGVED